MANELLGEDITPPFRLILNSVVAAKIRDGIPRASPAERAGLGLPYTSLVEVGGLMMGEHVEKNAFRVTHVSLSIGTPCCFHYDPHEHQPYLDGFLTSFPDRPRFGLIGSWHSHPSGDPEPSDRDLQTLKNTMTHPSTGLAFMVLLIACLDANARLKVGGVVLIRDSKAPSRIGVTIENGQTRSRPPAP